MIIAQSWKICPTNSFKMPLHESSNWKLRKKICSTKYQICSYMLSQETSDLMYWQRKLSKNTTKDFLSWWNGGSAQTALCIALVAAFNYRLSQRFWITRLNYLSRNDFVENSKNSFFLDDVVEVHKHSVLCTRRIVLVAAFNYRLS